MRPFLLVVLLSVPACTPDSKATPGQQAVTASDTAVVTGTIITRDSLTIPDGAILTVRLSDVSRADAAAMVIAEQDIRPVALPAAFSLAYDPATIDAQHTYVVQARIERDGKLIALNTQRFAVLGRDASEGPLEVVLDPVTR